METCLLPCTPTPHTVARNRLADGSVLSAPGSSLSTVTNRGTSSEARNLPTRLPVFFFGFFCNNQEGPSFMLNESFLYRSCLCAWASSQEWFSLKIMCLHLSPFLIDPKGTQIQSELNMRSTKPVQQHFLIVDVTQKASSSARGSELLVGSQRLVCLTETWCSAASVALVWL